LPASRNDRGIRCSAGWVIRPDREAPGGTCRTPPPSRAPARIWLWTKTRRSPT